MAFVPTTPVPIRGSFSAANNNTTSVTLRRPAGLHAHSVSTKRRAAVAGAGASRRAAPRCSEMGVSFPEKKYDEQLRIGVISTRWNEPLVNALRDDVLSALSAGGVTDDNVVQMQVPGAFELPMAARLMAAAQKVDAVVCLGVLVKGDTDHYDYIASAVSSGLMDLQLTLSTPMVFGVLCCNTLQQAEDRSTGDKSHAADWGKTAIEMAHLKKSQFGGVSSGKKAVGFF